MSDKESVRAKAPASPANSMPEWARKLKAVYPVKFLDWEAWQDVLTKAGFDGEFLCGLIDWMDGKAWKCPETAIDVRKAACVYRGELRRRGSGQQPAGGSQSSCGVCVRGIVSYCPELDIEAVIATAKASGQSPGCALYDAAMLSPRASIACTCDAGERVRMADPVWKTYQGDQLAAWNAQRRSARASAFSLDGYVRAWAKGFEASR